MEATNNKRIADAYQRFEDTIRDIKRKKPEMVAKEIKCIHPLILGPLLERIQFEDNMEELEKAIEEKKKWEEKLEQLVHVMRLKKYYQPRRPTEWIEVKDDFDWKIEEKDKKLK